MSSKETNTAKLTIFANFYINTEERLLRMKDSFNSFSQIHADVWVINCRGKYRDEVLDFLKDNLGDRLIPFRLNSKEGWFNDTRTMLPAIESEYVLFWLEDFINLAPVELLNAIVSEMSSNRLEYLIHSFWHFGRLRNRYDGIELTGGRCIDYFEHTQENNDIIQSNLGGTYIISAASILSTELFSRVILADDPIPKRWPKETPFDFEKAPTDIHWLPLRVAVPREELFASIDDDNKTPGSCLQSRGLYPMRIPRQTYAQDCSFLGKLKCNLSRSKNFLKSLFNKTDGK